LQENYHFVKGEKNRGKLVADFNCQKYFLVANAAIDGPMTIATAIIAAAFAISPDIPKTPILQFAMPKARALNISAITRPMKLIRSSFPTEATFFSVNEDLFEHSLCAIDIYNRARVKTRASMEV